MGDRILVNENKLGTLQFCGPVEFAGGTWAGVELDEPEGKNDGRVNNITYFTTQPGFGVMVPTNKVEKVFVNFYQLVKPYKFHSANLDCVYLFVILLFLDWKELSTQVTHTNGKSKK